jgi:hypothetical protein
MTSRREFLIRSVGTTAVAALLPELLLADPYRPLSVFTRGSRPVRVRGRVTANGRAVRGARVSDGRLVMAVDADGRFDFVTTDTQRFLTLCPPAGFELPTGRTGAMSLARRLSGASEHTVEFQLNPRTAGDERHAFLVLADPQTQNMFEMGRFHAETVPDVVTTVRQLGGMPSFGIGCGDLMYDDLALYPEYERAIQRMGIPFGQVVGNHDLDQGSRTTEGAVDTFQQHFGASHYSFDVGAVHYLVLNDVFWHGAGYVGYITEEQLAWVRSDLSHVERGRTVVVFLHIPSLGSQHERTDRDRPEPGSAVTNREALFALVDGYQAHLISGHTHESEHRRQGTIHEHVTGAVCGAWWSGDICFDGTPNGYAVYEAMGERLHWRYKSTGKPADHQLRLAAPGADRSAPGDLVANVWDWDPAWTVTWFEDGQPRGLMSRRRGKDPLSVEQHTGPEKPERRTWVEPMTTNHLFYAAASPSAQEWKVEAKDGNGRTYTETLRRQAPAPRFD